jgi:acyl-coenzyme A thioesterase PaaI-like protein
VAADLDRRHIVGELGMTVAQVGDELHGTAAAVPEMHVPGTDVLRASVLAAWTDVVAGLLSGQVIGPRVPVTLDLSVDLYRAPAACRQVECVGRTVKAGRSVVVASVEISADGEPLATASASFMPSPDASLRLPASALTLNGKPADALRLTKPFAERAGCRRTDPRVAVLERSDEGLNSSNTINGGLIALVVEEAALSASPGTTLASLAMRYLRPARVGPLVATATRHADVAQVDVRDAGSDDRLAVTARTRTFTTPS